MFGSFDQTPSEFEAGKRMDIWSFIFSGNPHMDGRKAFGVRLLPELKSCSLAHDNGRVSDAVVATPPGEGE
ncbi:MAG: hypothetical protein F4186_03675 [Boseongicola sp. SB0676_bin_33]|uniref:Uncharacterized protein n=1 Tax=Boseongicola sp. SB0664_bin_43 TaxID=2604844 RepID=A0A6B0Y5X9_9RHOB|nr:hypothetical protein [Boseongicola sp. SB0664_bin_43]MYF88533.1 hypothetical protein [Boseongicola sp. SB0676_bin_33]MYK31289.1 hypothetical protein [Boseongicola sp. SB0670_bin_30]